MIANFFLQPCMWPGLMNSLGWVFRCIKNFFPDLTKYVTKSHVIDLSDSYY